MDKNRFLDSPAGSSQPRPVGQFTHSNPGAYLAQLRISMENGIATSAYSLRFKEMAMQKNHVARIFMIFMQDYSIAWHAMCLG